MSFIPLLCAQFDGQAGENFKNGCAVFCRNQQFTLEQLKARVRKDTKMAQLLSVRTHACTLLFYVSIGFALVAYV